MPFQLSDFRPLEPGELTAQWSDEDLEEEEEEESWDEDLDEGEEPEVDLEGGDDW